MDLSIPLPKSADTILNLLLQKLDQRGGKEVFDGTGAQMEEMRL